MGAASMKLQGRRHVCGISKPSGHSGYMYSEPREEAVAGLNER